MSADGYGFDPEAAQRVEKGLRDAISELNELGLDLESQMGRGFSRLEVSHTEAGHAGLKSTFEEFCERWGWGVRGKIQEANELARGLGLSAGIYHEQEQYVSGTLKQAANASFGNPTLSEEQVEKQSWGQTLSDNPFTQVANADFEPVKPEELAQPWGKVGDDFSTSPLTPGVGQETDWQWGGDPAAEEAEGGNGEGDGGQR